MLTIRSCSFSLGEPTLVLLLLLFSLTNCHGKRTSPCVPSSCGNIHKITFPFRLKTDPKICGKSSYELECQNNRTILSLNSQRYIVQSINYDLQKIRIVDPALLNNNPCSFPLMNSSIPDAISRNDLYALYSDLNSIPLMFINCLVPANSSKYVDITFCTTNRNTGSPSNSTQFYRYAVGGDVLTLSDLEESCSIEMVTRVTSSSDTKDYTSLSRIHEAVTDGIELSWYHPLCKDCRGDCRIEANSVSCRKYSICYEDVPLSEKNFRCKLEYYAPFIIVFGVFPIVGILGLRFIIGFCCLMALIVYKRKKSHLQSEPKNAEDSFNYQYNFKPIRYSYSQIKKMTRNFKDKLGVGGYGTVFKGKLRSGPPVAIKMMDKSMVNAQEFSSAVVALGRFEHVNLMPLVGFCSEGSKRALVYDFMPNGSLQKYISSAREGESVSLSYEKLYEIALGVARGIDYLHRSSYGNQISHFGIKSHNVLLDENFIPKIADFGLTELYPRLRYNAPEFYYRCIGDVSHKADVYSFGTLLMEMISCRRKDRNSLVEHNQLLADKDIEIEDSTEEERKMLKKMIKVALWCIQMKPADRPSMSKVLEMLECDDVELPEMPYWSH